jgi:hypothetical protein
MSYTPVHVDRPTAPPRPKRTAVLIGGLIVLVLAAAGVTAYLTSGGTTDPAPAATSAAAATTPAAQATPATCPNGRLANGDCAGGTAAPNRLANDTMAPIVCPKILKAMGTQAIYDPDQMEPIGVQAGTSLDRDLAFAGLMLGDMARLTRKAKENNFPAEDQAKAVTNLGAAATALATVCTKAGFQQ